MIKDIQFHSLLDWCPLYRWFN